MEELRKDLELVSVDYENDGKKAVLTFLDREDSAVRVVNFNKQSYDSEKKAYIDDPKKAEKVEKWCDEYLSTTFDSLSSAIGSKHDIWVYEKFCSLFQVEQAEKFDEDMLGQIYQTQIDKVTVGDFDIRVRYKIDGKNYESKMSYGNWQETLHQWFVDPIKKNRQFEKFKTKFGVPVDKADTLIGHPLMVEVKKAMGKYLYGDMKAFPKKKD